MCECVRTHVASQWNRPVHEFLLRHVYLHAMFVFKLSKFKAMVYTFFVSIVAHEVVCAPCVCVFVCVCVCACVCVCVCACMCVCACV